MKVRRLAIFIGFAKRTIDFLERLEGGRFDDIQNRDDLRVRHVVSEDGLRSIMKKKKLLTFSLTPASLRNLINFSSRSVLRQNIECSKGAIFLIATFLPLGR
jgi:hypothetical protein